MSFFRFYNYLFEKISNKTSSTIFYSDYIAQNLTYLIAFHLHEPYQVYAHILRAIIFICTACPNIFFKSHLLKFEVFLQCQVDDYFVLFLFIQIFCNNRHDKFSFACRSYNFSSFGKENVNLLIILLCEQ